MSRVFIQRFTPHDSLNDTVAEALDWIGIRTIIPSGARVFIKPNLTWKRPTPGVTVTPAFLRALVETPLTFTPNITIGESEGGQASFGAEEAFETHSLYELQRAYGVHVVNLSQGAHETATTTVEGKLISVQLPSLLLHDVDVFVTVPVPKIHAMTGVSLGFKNQWGCLGDKMRVTLHPYFDKAILAINKILKPRLCIFDGTYFLDYTGPLAGEAVPMNLVIAGDNAGAASLACCEIMKIGAMSISHHRLACREGMFPKSLDEIEFNRLPCEFAQRQFRLRRAFLNYIHLIAFKNVLFNRLFYDSVFADPLHALLWWIRRHPPVKKLLYGKYINVEANRDGRTR